MADALSPGRYVCELPGDAAGVDPARQAQWSAQLAALRQSKDLVLEARQIEEVGQRDTPRWNELSQRIRAINPHDPYAGSLPAGATTPPDTD